MSSAQADPVSTGNGAAPRLQRTIGLIGATALVTGAVVGAGIYVMIAEIAALAGSAIGLAFVIAVFISVVGVLPLIQLAGALPRAGAGYLFASRLISPYWGVLTSYLVLLGGACSTVVVSVTLAVYLKTVIPGGLSINTCAVLIIVSFYVIYQFGVHLAISLQTIMTIQFVVVLLAYVFAGPFHADVQVSVTPPQGFAHADFWMAVLLCYSTCMGFQVVAELGEEVQHPRRNIPLSLLLGGVLVSALYIAVGQIFVSTHPWAPGAYEGLNAPLSESAAPMFPAWFMPFFNFGAVTAGWTSLNAAAIAIPREIFAQARDGLMPPVLGKVSARTHSPQHAVTAYFVLVIALLYLNQDKDFYGYGAAIGILIMSSIICICALRLPRRFPDRMAHAYIQFPPALLVLSTVFTVLVTFIFLAITALEQWSVFLMFAIWIVATTIFYFAWTRRWTEADWRRTQRIPGEENDAD